MSPEHLGDVRKNECEAERQEPLVQVAPVDDETVELLRSKHPVGRPSPFGTRAGSAPSSLPTVDLLRSAFASFKPDTAPGVSGWTPSLLGLALGNDDVQRTIGCVVHGVYLA